MVHFLLLVGVADGGGLAPTPNPTTPKVAEGALLRADPEHSLVKQGKVKAQARGNQLEPRRVGAHSGRDW